MRVSTFIEMLAAPRELPKHTPAPKTSRAERGGCICGASRGSPASCNTQASPTPAPPSRAAAAAAALLRRAPNCTDSSLPPPPFSLPPPLPAPVAPAGRLPPAAVIGDQPQRLRLRLRLRRRRAGARLCRRAAPHRRPVAGWLCVCRLRPVSHRTGPPRRPGRRLCHRLDLGRRRPQSDHLGEPSTPPLPSLADCLRAALGHTPRAAWLPLAPPAPACASPSPPPARCLLASPSCAAPGRRTRRQTEPPPAQTPCSGRETLPPARPPAGTAGAAVRLPLGAPSPPPPCFAERRRPRCCRCGRGCCRCGCVAASPSAPPGCGPSRSAARRGSPAPRAPAS